MAILLAVLRCPCLQHLFLAIGLGYIVFQLRKLMTALAEISDSVHTLRVPVYESF